MTEWFQGMEYIYEVYKEKSFSKAAKNLFISQPSLSANVKRIEARIGYPVFDRSTTPVRLTECGERYIRAVEEIMAVENSFYNYMTDFGGLKTGSLKLGGSSLFSSYVLPKLISAFTAKYPAVQIELIEESTANLEQLLAAGVLDIVVDNSCFDETVFGKKPYQKEHLVLAVPRAYSVNGRLLPYQVSPDQIASGVFLGEEVPAVSLEQFREFPFILLKQENDTRQRGIRLCKEYGFLPQVVLELDQQATAYNITCSGMGISFISDTLIRGVPPHPEVVYYKLSGQEVDRTLYFYWKQGKYISRAMEEFLRLAEKTGEA